MSCARSNILAQGALKVLLFAAKPKLEDDPKYVKRKKCMNLPSPSLLKCALLSLEDKNTLSKSFVVP